MTRAIIKAIPLHRTGGPIYDAAFNPIGHIIRTDKGLHAAYPSGLREDQINAVCNALNAAIAAQWDAGEALPRRRA